MDHILLARPGNLKVNGPAPVATTGPRPYAHAVRTLYASALVLSWRIKEVAHMEIHPVEPDVVLKRFTKLAERHEHLRNAVADVKTALDVPKELPPEIASLCAVAMEAAEKAEPLHLAEFARASAQKTRAALAVIEPSRKAEFEAAAEAEALKEEAAEADYGRRLGEAATAAGPIARAMAGY